MSFDAQPVLRGSLVELRPLRPEDLEAWYEVASDPLIWEQHPVKNRHELEHFTDFFKESLASGGALLVVDVTSGPENFRSQRAVEKIGGLACGTRVDAGGRLSRVYRISASTRAGGQTARAPQVS